MALPTFLSLQQEATLGSILSQNGLTDLNYSAHSNVLNAPTEVENDPAPQIPRELSLQEITDGVQPATAKKINGSGLTSDFTAAIREQNHTGTEEVIAFWEKSGDFTTEEIATLTELTSQTMAQPGWPATKPGPSIWVRDFISVYPLFTANVDGSTITDQCHALFVKEARGDAS